MFIAKDKQTNQPQLKNNSQRWLQKDLSARGGSKLWARFGSRSEPPKQAQVVHSK